MPGADLAAVLLEACYLLHIQLNRELFICVFRCFVEASVSRAVYSAHEADTELLLDGLRCNSMGVHWLPFLRS